MSARGIIPAHYLTRRSRILFRAWYEISAARPPSQSVVDLANAPRNRQRIASDPTRLVRRQEHRDRRYIVRLSGPPERRPRDILLLEIAADDASSMCALSFDRTRIDRVDPY